MKIDVQKTGHISAAVRIAFGEAKRTDERVEAEFNGTPFWALPDDQGEQAAFLRWHYERLLEQLRRGVITIDEAPR